MHSPRSPLPHTLLSRRRVGQGAPGHTVEILILLLAARSLKCCASAAMRLPVRNIEPRFRQARVRWCCVCLLEARDRCGTQRASDSIGLSDSPLHMVCRDCASSSSLERPYGLQGLCKSFHRQRVRGPVNLGPTRQVARLKGKGRQQAGGSTYGKQLGRPIQLRTSAVQARGATGNFLLSF